MSIEAKAGAVTLDAVSVAEQFSLDPARAGKKDTTVFYKSSANELYSVTLPSEAITKQKVQDAMILDYKARKNLLPSGVAVK